MKTEPEKKTQRIHTIVRAWNWSRTFNKKNVFFSSRLTFDTTAARKDTWLRFELNCLAKSFCWILLHLLQPNADDMELLSGDLDSHHETY